jgi:tetratricopeptide (TPR) repeat protein
MILEGAEQHLRAALAADPQMAEAAYNLCILLSKNHLDEAIGYCQKAVEIQPGTSLGTPTPSAFYRQQTGDFAGAAERPGARLFGTYPAYADAYLLLGGIYEKQGKPAEAVETYNRGLSAKDIPERYRIQMKIRAEALE